MPNPDRRPSPESSKHENTGPTAGQGFAEEELSDEELHNAAALDAQVRLLKQLCRLVAESWRAKHAPPPSIPAVSRPQEGDCR